MKHLGVAALIICSALAFPEYKKLPKPGESFQYTRNFTTFFAINTNVQFLPEEPKEITREVARCTHTCNGKKHPNHQACNMSCDTECESQSTFNPKPHTIQTLVQTIDQNADFSGEPKESHQISFGRLLTRTSAPNSVGTDLLSNDYRNLDRMFGLGYLESGHREYLDHWNKTPCSSAPLMHKFMSFKARIDIELIDKEFSNGKMVRKVFGKASYNVLALIPSSEASTPGTPEVNCRCTPKAPDEPLEHSSLPGTHMFDPAEGSPFATVNENGMIRPITQQDINNAVTNINCQDMNKAEIKIGGMLTGDYFFPAGWELESVDGKGQNVQIQQDILIKSNQAGQSLIVNIAPTPQADEIITLKTLCLQIDKPEPKPGQRYRLVPPSNPNLTKLAKIVKNTRFHTPAEQVRLWIATDKASYDKMSKILLPMVGEGTYLRTLHENITHGTVNPEDPKIREIAKQEFIHSDLFFPEPVTWLIRYKLSQDDKKFLEYLRTSAKQLTPFFTESPFENTEPDGEERLTTIVTALTQHQTPEATKLAIELLQTRPESLQPANTPPTPKNPQAPETAIAQLLIDTSNPEIAQLVLDWLSQTKPLVTLAVLPLINPNLPENIQSQAKSLLQTFPPPSAQ